MRLTGDVQAVVMAGGKGSRMTDLTAGKAKCLLPVGGLPLLWYPLHMLQCNGFTDAIVIVQDSAKAEVTRIPEKHGLSIKLEVVGIPGQEELGTADSLRRVSDRLTGSDILVVSGDLIMESEGLRGLTDMHRLNRAALTSLLGQGQSMEGVVVPGSKSTKYKRERDLVGLSGDQAMFRKTYIYHSHFLPCPFIQLLLCHVSFILSLSFGLNMMCHTLPRCVCSLQKLMWRKQSGSHPKC